jgi:hypothetical protein
MTIVEQISSRMSLAVRVVDDFSKLSSLAGATQVFITETGKTALQTPSGYYVFRSLSETHVTIRIDNKYYFPKEVAIDISALDPNRPVTTHTMTPGYLYPFPPATTLLRGLVVDGASHPVEGAHVSVTGTTVANESGGDGRFVLYWGPVGEDDISIVNHRRLLKIANSTTIALHVTHPSFQPKDVTIGTMVEGELTLLTTPIVMNP